jgi:hypothetical protein
MSFIKKEGSTGMSGLAPPPPWPPIRYEIAPVVCPPTVLVGTSVGSLPEIGPIPICPPELMVKMFLTKTLKPLVTKKPVPVIVRLL